MKQFFCKHKMYFCSDGKIAICSECGKNLGDVSIMRIDATRIEEKMIAPTWTRINHTDLFASRAIHKMEKNKKEGCVYHNFFHIKNMYQYLHETSEPYDRNLDWAILFHDVIYDSDKYKEDRSAEFFVNNCSMLRTDKLDIVTVVDLILETKQHVVNPGLKGSSAIIRADLSGLSNSVSVFNNYNLILQESMLLYNIDEKMFAINSEEFMLKLLLTILANKDIDKKHSAFWASVEKGILNTIKLSKIILD